MKLIYKGQLLNGVKNSAENIAYSNSGTTLASQNMQDAITEVYNIYNTKIGSTNISSFGDGTITGAIPFLYDNAKRVYPGYEVANSEYISVSGNDIRVIKIGDVYLLFVTYALTFTGNRSKKAAAIRFKIGNKGLRVKAPYVGSEIQTNDLDFWNPNYDDCWFRHDSAAITADEDHPQTRYVSGVFACELVDLPA